MAARTPGPIAAAEPLLATLGEYRQLHFAVTEADALLAVYAGRVPHLEDAFEMQLATLPELSEEAWAVGCPADMLAVARQADLFYCVPRREQQWATTMVTPWHPLDGTGAARALSRWLREAPMSDLIDVLHERPAVARTASWRSTSAAAGCARSWPASSPSCRPRPESLVLRSGSACREASVCREGLRDRRPRRAHVRRVCRLRWWRRRRGPGAGAAGLRGRDRGP